MNRFVPLSGKLIPRGRVPPKVAYESEISAIVFEILPFTNICHQYRKNTIL